MKGKLMIFFNSLRNFPQYVCHFRFNFFIFKNILTYIYQQEIDPVLRACQ